MYEEWKTREFIPELHPYKDLFLLITISFFHLIIRYILKKISFLLTKKIKNTKTRKKFFISFHKFIFYFSILIFQIFSIKSNFPFSFFEMTLTFKNNKFPIFLKLIYFLELIFYINSLIFLFFENKMKDFYVLIFHHLITLFLIIGSFRFNIIRYGIIVMIIHDVSDPFLEFSKLLIYFEKKKEANFIFLIFTFIFIFSRLLIFPFFILIPIFYYSLIYKSLIFLIFAFFLLMLLFLHFIWTYFIMKMVKKLFNKELLEGDIREEK